MEYFHSCSVYYRKKSLDDEPSVFLDPNEMSTDGTVAISSFTFSGDAKMVAYSFSESGSDWNKLKIRNVETGKDYPETLKGLKFSLTAWTSDNKGFFYAVIRFFQFFQVNFYEIFNSILFTAISQIR